MNFPEQLNQFVERGADKYFKDNFEYFNDDCGEGPKHAYKSGANSLKPIVLKLYEAAENLPCEYIQIIGPSIGIAEHLNNCFKCKTLSEVYKMLEGGSK